MSKRRDFCDRKGSSRLTLHGKTEGKQKHALKWPKSCRFGTLFSATDTAESKESENRHERAQERPNEGGNEKLKKERSAQNGKGGWTTQKAVVRHGVSKMNGGGRKAETPKS